MFEIEHIISIKMDLALNKLQRLICHKTQTTNQLRNIGSETVPYAREMPKKLSHFHLQPHMQGAMGKLYHFIRYIHQNYKDHYISFQTFFVWALLLIVHTWNSSPLRSNLLRLQCTCTVPTTSGRPHGSPLVWACQWPLSQPLSSPQLSHNDSLWV